MKVCNFYKIKNIFVLKFFFLIILEEKLKTKKQSGSTISDGDPENNQNIPNVETDSNLTKDDKNDSNIIQNDSNVEEEPKVIEQYE